MPRRFQFSLKALLALTLLVAVLSAVVPPVYEIVFPAPRVMSQAIVVEQGVRYYHLVWSNGIQIWMPADTPGEANNGRGRWRTPASTQPAAQHK